MKYRNLIETAVLIIILIIIKNIYLKMGRGFGNLSMVVLLVGGLIFEFYQFIRERMKGGKYALHKVISFLLDIFLGICGIYFIAVRDYAKFTSLFYAAFFKVFLIDIIINKMVNKDSENEIE